MLTHVFIASSSLPSSAASRRRVRSRTGPRRRTRPGARSGLARGIDVKSQNRVPADLQRPSRSIASAPPCGAHVTECSQNQKSKKNCITHFGTSSLIMRLFVSFCRRTTKRLRYVGAAVPPHCYSYTSISYVVCIAEP